MLKFHLPIALRLREGFRSRADKLWRTEGLGPAQGPQRRARTQLGEAVVMRNVGGRVTPEALRSWGLLGRLGAGQSPSGGHLAILHHTDYGIPSPGQLPRAVGRFLRDPCGDLGSKAVEDPYASVRIDVDIARHRLPPDLLVSGLVYDVDTGLIEVVVPATTELRPEFNE